MNAVEIEEAVSALAAQPFDPAEFPFSFLAAFGFKETTLKRLRKGDTNSSDVSGAVLQRNNIHLAVAPFGHVADTLQSLRDSPKSASAKVKFLLATDGDTVEAEDRATGETVAGPYTALAQHFGFFLPLAGITTVKEIKDNPIDVRATGRLNKLYIELLRHNPDWGTEARRHDLNHFMARLIFCFFAQDTQIFHGEGTFTKTVEQMTERDSSNTDQVIGRIFEAMNTRLEDRAARNFPGWADIFPYVNGGLFSGSADVPRFTRMARTYLRHAGELRWREINPDIFGSMIQAVAEDDERGALGMHYTSVPNILKVLNPLFLDDLRAQLEAAGTNGRTLLNLRRRIARIRVFDPACGSGNFLVIAYKQMREIEAEINRRRNEATLRSEIPLTNFRGIEIRDFPAEIARLALIIAEFQSDVMYRGDKLALLEFLPLQKENWITCGNALRIDWLSVCPPTGIAVKVVGDDLFSTPLDQPEFDFENEGSETFICGNPPYLGFTWQSEEQKSDLQLIFANRSSSWKSLDYVAGWLMKAADYSSYTASTAAFVATNSICQGQQVSILWPLIFGANQKIAFAYASFKWSNLAANKAGVTVIIVSITQVLKRAVSLYLVSDGGQVTIREVDRINAYLVPGLEEIVFPLTKPLDNRGLMLWGDKPTDSGFFFLNCEEMRHLLQVFPAASRFVRLFLGAEEFVQGKQRYCIWIDDGDCEAAGRIPELARRISAVAEFRTASKASETRVAAAFPHRFRQIQSLKQKREMTIVVPRVTSELRTYLPVGISANSIIGDRNFALYDAPLWNMALIASRLHWVWIGTVCVRLEMRFSYSNTLGWNTFPVPTLTDQNKLDLTRCAENILLAREAHFPATIADLYEPDNMPENLRLAHDRNDETLEHIYIGRRFRNDTERLEKLFELYTKMTASPSTSTKKKSAPKRKSVA